MQKSPEIKNLALALAEFQKEVPKIKKDSVNPFFKNKYADLATIIETVRPTLAKFGLSVSQFPTGEHLLTTILMHDSGEWIEDTYYMRPVDEKPQSVGSSITYARRYALTAVLGIAADEDDDGNAASTPEKKVPATVTVSPVERKLAEGLEIELSNANTLEELEVSGAKIKSVQGLSVASTNILRKIYNAKKLTLLAHASQPE